MEVKFMRNLFAILLIISIISIPVCAETMIGLELYPDRMNGIFENGNLVNGEEWFATTVEIEKTFSNRLNIRFNIKTFLFGTNGLSYYPSSVKFINSISYRFELFTIKWKHFCHHYFHHFEDNYNDSDKITLEYSF